MATVDLPTYIPLSEATAKYRLGHRALTRLVESGRIRAVQIDGGVAVAEEDVNIVAIQVDDSLRGCPVRLAEAAEKYGVSDTNLVRWATAGYIRVVERGPKLLMLDEADVKLVAEIFKRAREETGSYVRAGWILKRALEQLRV
jgi:hypothetical protein